MSRSQEILEKLKVVTERADDDFVTIEINVDPRDKNTIKKVRQLLDKHRVDYDENDSDGLHFFDTAYILPKDEIKMDVVTKFLDKNKIDYNEPEK